MSNRQDDALPELPEPRIPKGFMWMVPVAKHDYFIADQMREYAQSAIASLQARLDAAEADAARYRWLRERSWCGSPMCVVMAPYVSVKLGSDCPSLDRLDAAIDAARSAT